MDVFRTLPPVPTVILCMLWTTPQLSHNLSTHCHHHSGSSSSHSCEEPSLSQLALTGCCFSFPPCPTFSQHPPIRVDPFHYYLPLNSLTSSLWFYSFLCLVNFPSGHNIIISDCHSRSDILYHLVSRFLMLSGHTLH